VDVGRSFGEAFGDAGPNANTDGRGVSFGEPERKWVGPGELIAFAEALIPAFRFRCSARRLAIVKRPVTFE
jgi:hypothetical protein